MDKFAPFTDQELAIMAESLLELAAEDGGALYNAVRDEMTRRHEVRQYTLSSEERLAHVR